jgi:hypothetical protein
LARVGPFISVPYRVKLTALFVAETMGRCAGEGPGLAKNR